MTLRPDCIGPVPDATVRVARAAFPRGSRYLHMRDAVGTIFADAAFAALYSTRGRPGAAPWRLALGTVMPFAAGLADRQAAEAVRARIDGKVRARPRPDRSPKGHPASTSRSSPSSAPA